jgi:ammonium transporter, Amt family
VAIGAAGAWSAVVTFVLLKAIDKLVGLRVDPEVEHDGLDGALHGESAYAGPGSVAHGS